MASLPLAGSLAAAANDTGSEKPVNVLYIIADDMNADSMGCFGCPVPDTTPNLDKLAAEGMKFNNAHVTIAVCQPSRTVVQTGLYPHRSGARGFTHCRENVPTMIDLFHNAGYLTSAIGKIGHTIGKKSNRKIMHKLVGFNQLNCGRDPELYYKYSDEFFKKAKQDNKPFLFLASSHDPHRPFHNSRQEKHVKKIRENLENIPAPSKVFQPDEIKMLSWLPDLPDIRKEIAQYYSSVRRCDDSLGKVLDALKENGLEENTIVIYYSDNGISVPFAKTNCYLHSTKTPLIIKWPDKIKPGTVNNEMISNIDHLPTLCEIANIEKPEDLDGRSFLPALAGKKVDGFDKVFTQFHETSAKRRYPIRCVQDKKFGYIYNPWSDEKREFKNEAQTGLTWQAMKKTAESDQKIKQRVEFYSYRTLEEFYDLQNDPDCMNNLIDDPAYKKQIEQKRNELLAWMKKTNDPALVPFRNRNNEKLRKEFMKQQDTKARSRKKH